MTKAKNTKRALLASVLSMMLCVVMLIGATYAWFTDTASSGNNRIQAGNLKIDLLAADGSELEEDKLFGENLIWEPGQMYYRELKVVNKGSLAAKFNVCINEDTIGCNFVLFPNEDGTYSLFDEDGCDYSLSNVIRVAVYEGLFEDLSAETEAATGKTYTNDRNMLKDALNYEVIENDMFSYTNANDGGLYRDTLLPNGEKNPDGTAGDEKVFTLIAYWAMEGDWIYEDEDFLHVDDDYNLNNGKKATDILTSEEYDLLTGGFEEGCRIPAEAFGDSLKSTLKIDFDITVFAAQTSYESDSFDNTYDDENKDIDFVEGTTTIPPILGND